MTNENTLYQNYVKREPHPRSARIIRRWHGRLLRHVLNKDKVNVRNVLEIGPGHGYFAENCRELNIAYEFVDTSSAVATKMWELGFEGSLSSLHDLPADKKFDLIWLSHVLEHSASWVEARALIFKSSEFLREGGKIVIVSPDILNWRHEFWNVDWSHGYPTSLRNTIQLVDDVGLECLEASHHRNAWFSIFGRGLMTVLSKIPHRFIDRLLSPKRYKEGDGFVYSWKAVFGWRQILIVARKP